MSLEFLLTSLIVVLIPGTGVVYTISTGLFRGWKASVFASVGCTLGILPQFLHPGAGSTLVQMLVLSGVFMAHSIRHWILKSPKFLKRMSKTFAVTFAALDVELALAEK